MSCLVRPRSTYLMGSKLRVTTDDVNFIIRTSGIPFPRIVISNSTYSSRAPTQISQQTARFFSNIKRNKIKERKSQIKSAQQSAKNVGTTMEDVSTVVQRNESKVKEDILTLAWCSVPNHPPWPVYTRSKIMCPSCKYPTQGKITQIIAQQHTHMIVEYGLDGLVSEHNHPLPFDACITNLKVLIEFDGAHHFRQISDWKSPQQTCWQDVRKMRYAIDKGYKILRIHNDCFKQGHISRGAILQQVARVGAEEAGTVRYLYSSHAPTTLYDKHKKYLLMSVELFHVSKPNI